MAEPTDNLANLASMADDELLDLARERWQAAVNAESAWRIVAAEDLRFRRGDQWDESIKALRAGHGGAPGRPCLTINRVQSNIQGIKNAERLNKIGIKVIPVDDDADPDTATVIQGLVRHIEARSRANVAYETAFTAAVERGKGFFRIVTEFAEGGPTGFEQDIHIKRIRNPFSVYFDPSTQEIDFSDANWAFIITRMSRRAFRSDYPQADHDNLNLWQSRNNSWVNDDEVQVAEYYFKERNTTELGLLEDGRVLPVDEMTVAERRTIKTRRRDNTPTVWHYITNGFEVLEKTRVPSPWIPIVPILGDEIDDDGTVDYAGVVRYAKDPQRAYNYWVSSAAEMIAMAPKAPVVGVTGQFENHEAKWNSVNNVPYGYMEYNAVDVDGRPAPPPRRLESIDGVTIQAITLERQQAADDLKATTGRFDASLGARSNETSGVAIKERRGEGEVSNYHFTDSKMNALWHAGRILVAMIPQVYDTARTVRILGEDESESLVTLNQEFKDESGKKQLYDLSVGKYDVDTTVGASFGTKRQEALDLTTGLVDKYPPLFPIIGDLVLKNIDGPGAEEMANRFRKTIQPELLEASDEATTEEQLRVQVQTLTRQMQQMQAAGQQLMQQTQDQQAEFDKMKVQLASKEQELALKERELALETRFRARELALEEEIERGKLELLEEKQALEFAKNGR